MVFLIGTLYLSFQCRLDNHSERVNLQNSESTALKTNPSSIYR